MRVRFFGPDGPDALPWRWRGTAYVATNLVGVVVEHDRIIGCTENADRVLATRTPDGWRTPRGSRSWARVAVHEDA